MTSTPKQRKHPPARLAKSGKAFWRGLTAETSLDAAEYMTSELLCAQLDTLDKLDAEMADMSVVVAGSEGQPVVNPLLRERRETIKQIDALTVALAIPVAGEAHGQRRSGATKAAAKAGRPPKIGSAEINHLLNSSVPTGVRNHG